MTTTARTSVAAAAALTVSTAIASATRSRCGTARRVLAALSFLTGTRTIQAP